MRRLEGAMRAYAWGSRTAIAELCGLPGPSPHPEAELWFGAHPADPARAGDRTLLQLIERDPQAELGSAAAEFGRLPFLLKVLAAEEPLSLQAHPSLDQAAAGFAEENRDGLPLDSPVRNYKDDNHKPELIVALSRFDALAGFADPAHTVSLLRTLDVSELSGYVELLAGQPDSAGLRALFTTWITLPSDVVADLVPKVAAACTRYLVDDEEGVFAASARTAVQLAEGYPGDAGVLASLMLNRITLEPGQGLFLPAGNLHAYLHGLAVEIMANSDNVLRGGLTPKHVDVPELLKVLDFEPVADPVIIPTSTDTGADYPTPTREFALCRTDLVPDAPPVPVTVAGPNIVLCTAGEAELICGEDTLTLTPGSAAWISANDPVVMAKATSESQLFTASVGSGRI